MSPKRITFPEHDPEEWKTGDGRSATRDISIDKHVSRDFSLLAPEVEEFLRRALIYVDFVLPSRKFHQIFHLEKAEKSLTQKCGGEDLSCQKGYYTVYTVFIYCDLVDFMFFLHFVAFFWSNIFSFKKH